MTAEKIQDAYNQHCIDNVCLTCKYSPAYCHFSFAFEEVEVFDIEKWANDIAKKYKRDERVSFVECDNVIIAFISENRRVKNIGIATCSEEDKFSCMIGNAIAYCKATGIKIPKEIYQ